MCVLLDLTRQGAFRWYGRRRCVLLDLNAEKGEKKDSRASTCLMKNLTAQPLPLRDLSLQGTKWLKALLSPQATLFSYYFPFSLIHLSFSL